MFSAGETRECLLHSKLPKGYLYHCSTFGGWPHVSFLYRVCLLLGLEHSKCTKVILCLQPIKMANKEGSCSELHYGGPFLQGWARDSIRMGPRPRTLLGCKTCRVRGAFGKQTLGLCSGDEFLRSAQILTYSLRILMWSDMYLELCIKNLFLVMGNHLKQKKFPFCTQLM